MKTPFVVTLTFVTPIALTIPPTLDALLAGELALHVGDERALVELPLLQTDRVWHASQLYLDTVNVRSTLPKVTMRETEPRSMPVEQIRGNGKDDGIYTTY